MTTTHLLLICLTVTMTACHEAGEGHSKDVNPDTIYFDYSITAEENEEVTCMFRYRIGGPEGRTLFLDEPSKVELDGQRLMPDTARFTGIFYEVSKPAANFAGEHNIVFTASDKRQYKEKIDFDPFELENELPERISRKPFTIQINHLPENEKSLHLVMTDTGYATNDVDEMVTVVNGAIMVDEEMLSRLTEGPIWLQLSRETETPLQQKTKQGGRLYMRYGLKRNFELTN
jgi:hypothetical protein